MEGCEIPTQVYDLLNENTMFTVKDKILADLVIWQFKLLSKLCHD